MELIERLCVLAREQGASDIFLHEGQVPQFRIHGRLLPLDTPPETPVLSPGELDAFWTRCRVPLNACDFDASFVAEGEVRYRVNFFRALDRRGAVLRAIKIEVPSLESLGVPVELLTDWITRPSGLVLVSGPTGTGKSTTVAACLDWLNRNRQRHIVTIEDPIEYLFRPDGCLFTQREVGTDTPSFAEGLRRSLRQSPDVIFLGEIRDGPSAITALQAAETGHLVLATLHSSNVLDSMERLSRLFDRTEREGVLQILAQQLVGILCQRLLPAEGRPGRVVAVEHVENRGVTRKWILEGKFTELADFVAKGDNPRNVTFLRSLVALVRSRRIGEATAVQAAPNGHEVERVLRGIGVASQ